jgi:hypothetical protein
MFFANEQREKVREDNPGIKFGMSALHAHLQAFSNIEQARSARFLARSGKP